MWWAGFAGPPHVTTHLCGDAMPTDLECTCHGFRLRIMALWSNSFLSIITHDLQSRDELQDSLTEQYTLEYPNYLIIPLRNRLYIEWFLYCLTRVSFLKSQDCGAKIIVPINGAKYGIS